MCGIFGIFLRRPLTDRDVELGRAAIGALRHRGPKSNGEWMDREKGVFLGHTRLVTYDPSSASAQPMARDGACITFNGEIYNFSDLRERLKQRGVGFASTGDTEVLLQGWRTWGEDALEKLDGAFAFAVWDGSKAELAVDQFGQKGIYIAELPDGVYVCNELAPLVRLLDLAPDLSGDALLSYLALGYVAAPQTAYPQVRRMGAGMRATIQGGRIARSWRYWRCPIGEPGRGPAQPLSERQLDELRDAVLEGLAGRLVADAPLCLFLSSGVDSSLVAALAKREFGADIEALTVSFPDGGTHDESEAAAATARHLGLAHRVFAQRAGRDGGKLDRMLDALGQPADTTGVISYQLICGAINREYDLALTGGGADEILLGLNKHSQLYAARGLHNAPEWMRLAAGALARMAPIAPAGARRVAREFGVPDAERFVAHRNYPAIPALRRVDGFSDWAARFAREFPRPIEQFAAAYETWRCMPEGRGTALDVGTMSRSVSTRSPYLTQRVAETAARMDPRSLLQFGQKDALRRLLGRYLPDSLIERRKLGFVIPTSEFLSEMATEPVVPGVPQAVCAEAWRRREERGWSLLALRLALAHRFHERNRRFAPRAAA